MICATLCGFVAFNNLHCEFIADSVQPLWLRLLMNLEFLHLCLTRTKFLLWRKLLLPDTDVILHSSDWRDFRVLKWFVIESSPRLDKLIQATSVPPVVAVPAGTETPLPIVHMSESGAPFICSSVEQTMELPSVAQKYEMSYILAHIRGSIAWQVPYICS